MVNALAYTSINNNSKNKDDISYFSKVLNSDIFDKTSTYNDQYKVLDKILKETSIKRGCCLMGKNDKKKSIGVRIPIPNSIKKNINDGTFKSSNLDMMNSFGYYDSKVTIPKEICKSEYKRESPACDNFYYVYCKNVLDEFNRHNKNKTHNHNEFVRYKPECACYGDTKSIFGNAIPDTFPRKCIFSGCGVNAPRSYVDKASREGSCSLNVCEQLINTAKANVGGDINIKAKLKQQCGDGGKKTKGSDNITRSISKSTDITDTDDTGDTDDTDDTGDTDDIGDINDTDDTDDTDNTGSTGDTSGNTGSTGDTSGKTTSGKTTSDKTTSDKTKSGKTTSGKTTSDKTTSDKTTSDKTTSGKTTSDKTTSGKTTSNNTNVSTDTSTTDMNNNYIFIGGFFGLISLCLCIIVIIVIISFVILS